MSTGAQRAKRKDKPDSQALPLLNDAVLGLIRAQSPLPKILEVLCTHIEKQHPGLLCSVLLLDADGVSLRHGAAPSLPAEYSQAVDGIQIGPVAGLVLGNRSSKLGAVLGSSSGFFSCPPRASWVSTITSQGAFTTRRGLCALSKLYCRLERSSGWIGSGIYGVLPRVSPAPVRSTMSL